MIPPADTSLSRLNRAPLRFGLLVGLGMAGCTLLVLALWTSTETHFAQSAADTVSGSELKEAEDIALEPADDVTAAEFQNPPETAVSPYSESAAPMTGEQPPQMLTPLPDGPEPRRRAYEWQGTGANASALPSADAIKPRPETASRMAPRLFPPNAGKPDRLGAVAPGANLPDVPTDTAAEDLSIATDPPGASAPGHQAPEMDASPAATRTFPLIEFESSGYPHPNSQPVHLNP